MKLGRNPMCENPDAVHDAFEAATQVDHIVPLAWDISRAFDMSNLMSLCTRCHALKSAAERREGYPG